MKFLAVALLTLVLVTSLAACRNTGSSGGGGGASNGGNATAGKADFTSHGCPTCHTLKSVNATGTIGPDLDGIAQRAGTREPGKSAEQYIDESIKDPAAFVVPGYPAPSAGGMVIPVPVTDAERKDLVAFLLTQ